MPSTSFRSDVLATTGMSDSRWHTVQFLPVYSRDCQAQSHTSFKLEVLAWAGVSSPLCDTSCGPFANVDQALEHFDHLQGDVQGDGDEVAIKDEARHKGIACHHPRATGVCGAVAVVVWAKVPGVQRELRCK